MTILKIGPLASPQSRWEDALAIADHMIIFTYANSEPKDPCFKYFELRDNLFCDPLLRKSIRYLSRYRKATVCVRFLLFLRRLLFRKELQCIANQNYDEVLVSYNDFDDSAELLVLIKPFLKAHARITRSYKETRPGFSYLEREAFRLADRIVLNREENVGFFEHKYGNGFFQDKQVVVGLDEDAIGSKYVREIKKAQKLSSIDGKKHVVILAGRVFSDPSNKRSGSRLFYVPMIKRFIDAGLIVHLHTMQIINDDKGINQYQNLAEQNPGKFIIEEPLDFVDDWENAYAILSRYDYGVLHNYIEGTPNTQFDRYNIPHRYYEYELAGVTPLLQDGETEVLQRLFEERHTGLIYNDEIELLQDHPVNYEVTEFAGYIRSLYGDNQIDKNRCR